MKNEIIARLNDPKQLENLYRSNKAKFKQAFNAVYPEIQGHTASEFWHERLNNGQEEISWGTGGELALVIIFGLLSGLVAKFPSFFNINEDYFYPRNLGFIVFPFLTAYFAWKHKIAPRKVLLMAIVMLAGLVYINFLPDNKHSDTLILACIHLALVLWAVLGAAFVGGAFRHSERRLGFLKYNGDLVVMSALILIAGGIMSAITVGLFNLIGFNIEQFYFENVAVFGLAAVPIIATFLTQSNPQLVGKVSPVIARLFSPLVAVMLAIFLISMIYAAKNPYNNREFLLIFNVLLIGVMAIIFFSIAETTRNLKNNAQVWILFVLSVLTIIVNGIALSAILIRINEWGFTPNRTAVMGGNVLILIHLVMVTARLYRVLAKRAEIGTVGRAIAMYLPVYLCWAVIVTFVFPVLFGFR